MPYTESLKHGSTERLTFSDPKKRSLRCFCVSVFPCEALEILLQKLPLVVAALMVASVTEAGGRGVTLTSLDGTPLAGELYEASARPAPGVVLIHMLTRTKAIGTTSPIACRMPASPRWRSICAGTVAPPDRRWRCRPWCRTCAPRRSGWRRGRACGPAPSASSAPRSAPAWHCWRRWTCRWCARSAWCRHRPTIAACAPTPAC